MHVIFREQGTISSYFWGTRKHTKNTFREQLLNICEHDQLYSGEQGNTDPTPGRDSLMNAL